jgi:hypothetical protein
MRLSAGGWGLNSDQIFAARGTIIQVHNTLCVACNIHRSNGDKNTTFNPLNPVTSQNSALQPAGRFILTKKKKQTLVRAGFQEWM